MKPRAWFLSLALLVSALLAPPAGAKCSPGLVRHFGRRAVQVAYRAGIARPAPVSIEWFGHAFFRFISPGGLRVVTDPFSPFRGFPIPKTNPDVATISEEAANHSFVGILGGSPLILRGVTEDGADWAEIDRRVKDVRIISVPIVQGGGDYDVGAKAASFLFEMGGLCIAHLGDLAAPMNPTQLRRLGRVHVALVILSDPGAMDPATAAKFIQRLHPNIAIPMDIRSDDELRTFLRGFRRVRRAGAAKISVSRRTLPPPTEVIVLRQPPEREG
jgi:L-ascorbate metabolism protein UlaG (beta-lactamase superfamily)